MSAGASSGSTLGADRAAASFGSKLGPGRAAAPLSRRVGAALEDLGVRDDHGSPTLVVAFSGGLDSCALLHVLRFALRPVAHLVAAHFDHGMRPGSVADAAWARGVCTAWGVEYASERAASPPAGEADARDARYDFLERMRRRYAPALVLTAHHADDQAETVLFRILRGTGIDGLRGMPAAREPGIVRPMLGLWREELEAYAASVGLRWREDPTNEHLGYARRAEGTRPRGRLRHQ